LSRDNLPPTAPTSAPSRLNPHPPSPPPPPPRRECAPLPPLTTARYWSSKTTHWHVYVTVWIRSSRRPSPHSPVGTSALRSFGWCPWTFLQFRTVVYSRLTESGVPRPLPYPEPSLTVPEVLDVVDCVIFNSIIRISHIFLIGAPSLSPRLSRVSSSAYPTPAVKRHSVRLTRVSFILSFPDEEAFLNVSWLVVYWTCQIFGWSSAPPPALTAQDPPVRAAVVH
jgi:hypothetical protein